MSAPSPFPSPGHWAVVLRGPAAGRIGLVEEPLHEQHSGRTYLRFGIVRVCVKTSDLRQATPAEVAGDARAPTLFYPWLLYPSEEQRRAEEQPAPGADRLAVSIEECEFSTRLVTILRKAGIKTLRDAFERGKAGIKTLRDAFERDEELPGLDGMGIRLFAEVRAAIEDRRFVPGDWVVVTGPDAAGDVAYLGRVGLVVTTPDEYDGTRVQLGPDGPLECFSAYDLRPATPAEVRMRGARRGRGYVITKAGLDALDALKAKGVVS
jgi:hypothetical protein